MFKAKRERDLRVDQLSQTIGLYSVYDRISCEYGPIFQAKNDQVALRNFYNLLKGVTYKDDFDLYHIGSRDENMNLYQNLYIVDVPLTDDELEVVGMGKSIIEKYDNTERKKEYINKLIKE